MHDEPPPPLTPEPESPAEAPAPSQPAAPRPAEPVPSPEPSFDAEPLRTAGVLLLSPDTPPFEKSEAAATLVSAAASAAGSHPDRQALSISLIASALASPEADEAARQALLSAIGSAPVAPATLGPPIAAISQAAVENGAQAADTRLLAIRALSSVRTRESAQALLALVREREPIRSAAFEALARLSGLDDLGADAARWETWFATQQWIPETEWRRNLVAGLAQRNDALAEEAAIASRALAEAHRRQWQSLQSADERSALIADLLRSDLPALEALGAQLATQELANARPLTPVVAESAAERLASARTVTRARAAELLALVATSEQSAAVYGALARETDPAAARHLLACAARSPSIDVLDAALRWAAYGPDTAPAAIDALHALHEAGLIADPEPRARCKAALSAIDQSRLETLQAQRCAALLGALQD